MSDSEHMPGPAPRWFCTDCERPTMVTADCLDPRCLTCGGGRVVRRAVGKPIIPAIVDAMNGEEQ